jgi:Smg protein
MDNSVFDILVYVFDHYQFAELPAATERAEIARDLETAGFRGVTVRRALDWLAALADQRGQPDIDANSRTFRLYTPEECARLDVDCRGMLLALERGGILSATQREIVIERLLALDGEELNLEQVKWVVLMVLTSKASDAATCDHFAELMQEPPVQVPH